MKRVHKKAHTAYTVEKANVAFAIINVNFVDWAETMDTILHCI